jgi:hypothetical protein
VGESRRWFDDEVLSSEGDVLLVQRPEELHARRLGQGVVGRFGKSIAREQAGIRPAHPVDDYVSPLRVKVLAPT